MQSPFLSSLSLLSLTSEYPLTPPTMTIIGFDVSKDELVGARIDRRAVLKESITIENTDAAIIPFLADIQDAYPGLLIACEATAEYHRPLMKLCLERSIPFKLINPILTKQFTRATIRKQKTDATDAWIVAKLGLQGEGTLATMDMLDPSIALTRLAVKLQRMTSLMSAVTSRFTRVFPEEKDIQIILNIQTESFGHAVETLRRMIIERSDPKLVALLSSLPGVAQTLAPIFITEIRDMHRFTTAKSLAAYAGLDPKIKQSGKGLKHNTHLTKRGSPFLRRAAYIAAQIARQHDPELKEYFQKKINEGKRYKEAMVATARKLLYRVYAVWKRGTAYVQKESTEKQLSTAKT